MYRSNLYRTVIVRSRRWFVVYHDKLDVWNSQYSAKADCRLLTRLPKFTEVLNLAEDGTRSQSWRFWPTLSFLLLLLLFFFFSWLEDSYIQYIRHKFLTWFCSNNWNLSSNSRYDGRVENRNDLIRKKTAFHGQDFDYSHSNNNTLITFAILNSKLTHKLINQMDKPKNKETDKFFHSFNKKDK